MKLTDTPQPKPGEAPPLRGVPIGGVGTGFVDFGPDGRFRNVSINNNRRADSVIPLLEHSFLAIRAGSERPYVRILQHENPDAPSTLPAPPRLKKKHLAWRGLYPVANYAVRDPDCPATVVVSVFSPIIPFDYDASSLPLLLFGVRCENPTEEALEVSVLFNVECPDGQTATTPARRGPGAIVTALEEQPKIQTTSERRTRAKDSAPEEPPPVRHNGIEMGALDPLESSANGQYCVAGRPAEGIEISLMPWDTASAEDEAALWTHFTQNGHLDKAVSTSDAVTAGAVCAQMTLAPGQAGRADFVFAWYCPRFDVEGHDQGNGYTNRLKSAVEVAKTGLRNVEYYYASVEGWRGRLKASSLPRWLNDTFINSCHVLTTNAIFTRDGRFGLEAHAGVAQAGLLHLHRFHALGTLLFFPRYEELELTLHASAEDPLLEKRLPGNLGRNCLHEPDFRNVDPIQVDLASEFILTAYRNNCFIGNPARLRALLPRLKEAMILASGRDRDGDGLPEISTPLLTYDGIQLQGLNVITCGLWIAAMNAYIRIAESTRQPEEVARYAPILRQATRTFERYFWDEERGYYRLSWDPRLPAEEQPPQHAACHSAQLAGQWYADFLGLGTIHDRSRVARALNTLEQYNERTFGLLSAVMPDGRPVQNPDGSPNHGHLAWPAFTTAQYACLQIQRGNVERGMRILEKTYRNMLYKHDRTFNHPDRWDLQADQGSTEGALNRHVGALSIWYVLYAITGLELNMAEACIRIMPRLPRGIHSLNTLLFTPACLGWLRYQEDCPSLYRQRLHLSLDSPITLQTIELRLPKDVLRVTVNCELPDGRFEVSHELLPADNARRLVLKAKRPIIANTALSIEVVALPASDETPAG